MQERRQYKRTDLVTYSRVYSDDGQAFYGYVCDMSPSGLMTLNDSAVEPETQVTLKIEVPPLPMSTRVWMRIPARAAWCQPDLDPKKYNIGWQFQSTTPEDQEIIAAILTHYDLYENRY